MVVWRRCIGVVGIIAAIVATSLPMGAAAEESLTLGTPTVSLTSASPEQRLVPSVVGAFNGLSQSADALIFARNGSPNASTCKHYQGLARKDGPDGTPYMILTKSGNVPFGCGAVVDEAAGYLIVARMGSREKTGERLRTNFLPYGSSLIDHPTLADDKAVSYYAFDGGSSGLPAYRHPGGVQILGDIMAVGTENPFGGETHRATVLFFNVHDPENPILRSRFDLPHLDDDGEMGADPVALTSIKAPDGTCCRYLLAVTGGNGNRVVQFFRSLPDPGSTTTDLNSTSLGWEIVAGYTEGRLEHESCLDRDWPSGLGSQHQLLNFVREGDLSGDLYLLGGLRDGAIANPTADERLDLYRMQLDSNGVPNPSCPFKHVKSKLMGEGSWGALTYTGSFAAGSSVYVSPSGELIVYVSNHEGSAGDTVVFGEYRIGSLVRANSPTLRPTTKVDGPFVIDEGSSAALTGRGEAPITKAFIQLFGNPGVGRDFTGGHWMSVEYDLRHADNFGQLDRMRGQAILSNEATSSWRWFAPPGCTISANDYPRRSDEFPGPDTVQLRGTGLFEEVHDLASLPVYRPPGSPYPVSPVPAGEVATIEDYDNDVGGVSFYEAYRDANDALVLDDGCDRYYAAQYTLDWDLDGDSSFESSGTSVTFNAAAIDGPATRVVEARAQHPTDRSHLGNGPVVPASVTVRNVAPRIGLAAVRDTLGYDLDGGSRPAILGLPLNLTIDFTDPGIADTQTATIDWGDGTALDSSFSLFSDARNGSTGHLRDVHTYSAPGSYTITATIRDDDGGVSTEEFTIVVLSLRDVIEDVADELTDLIDQTTNPLVASALRAARDELIGNHGGTPPTNGAIDKLDANDPVGAITKLRSAISHLITAESAGAGDLSHLKHLLGLVAEGIATSTYQKAKDAHPAPKPGQAKALASIARQIQEGHQLLADRLYLDACDRFRAATEKALELMR